MKGDGTHSPLEGDYDNECELILLSPIRYET